MNVCMYVWRYLCVYMELFVESYAGAVHVSEGNSGRQQEGPTTLCHIAYSDGNSDGGYGMPSLRCSNRGRRKDN